MVKKAVSRKSSAIEGRSEIENLLGDENLESKQEQMSQINEVIDEFESSVIQTDAVE
jgi:hypothetical protein